MVESMTSLKSLLFAEGEMALAARRDGVLFQPKGLKKLICIPFFEPIIFCPNTAKGRLESFKGF
jgi:hypothetical protein